MWKGHTYIVLYDKHRKSNDYYIHPKDKTYGTNAAFSRNEEFVNYLKNPATGITIREATPEEDRWLRKCIQENAYVECPKEEIINQYELY